MVQQYALSQTFARMVNEGRAAQGRPSPVTGLLYRAPAIFCVPGILIKRS